MSRRLVQSKKTQWLHVSEVNESDFEFLQTQYKFHHLDYEDVRAEVHLSKLDTYKHYLFFVFHIPTFHQKTNRIGKETLYLFLADKQVVTVTHHGIKQVDDLFDQLNQRAKYRSNLLSKGSAFLMYQILMDAFRQSRVIITIMSDEVERLENEINHRHDKAVTVDLGHARRNVLYMRHVIDPQRNILASLINIKRSFIPEGIIVYLDDLQDSLDTIWLSVDNLKLLIDGLFDVNEALLSHQTNQVITVLTIISASLMIPTFIAGFYGMNVPWLPYAHDPVFVSLLYVTCFLGILGLVLLVVRRSRH